jgi:hypothetical protein
MLLWQLLVLFVGCLGVGLAFRPLIPNGFSPLNKVLFSLLSGLFLVVLIPQNLVYLGVPVRISAWLVLGAAVAQMWLCRHQFIVWRQLLYSNIEIRTLTAVVLVTIVFHGAVPAQQGLERYYGKGYEDQLNYVLLAEFLKEQPYSTGEGQIALHPWLIRPVGFHVNAEQLGMSSGPGLEVIGLKKERIGQSIITAEISTWSGTDGKGGFAATIIFFLTILAICLYVLLRETGIDCFMAASGGLLAAFLPVITRLSLNGFLSQVSILFVFPFFASLLRHQELNARSFTLLFSLTLAYIVATYSEIAPIGFCTFFLGVLFIRRDQMGPKRLMLMSAILLIALVNPFYLHNLIGFLWQQYNMAANAKAMEHMVPNLLNLRGWSELIFGVVTNAPLASWFDCWTLLLGVLLLAGGILLSRRDQLIFGAILLPVLLVILYLATRTSSSYYPIAKITLTIFPFVIGLVFVPFSRLSANHQSHFVGMLTKLVCASIVTAAAAGSFRYYLEVLDNQGLLRYLREPGFLKVCHDLEKIKNKRVLVFETNPLLTRWLCYHARHNDVFFDGRFISDSPVPPTIPFAKIPDLENVDLIATRDRIVDPGAATVSCLTLVDDLPGEEQRDGHEYYSLGPPVDLRFLASRPISANLKMRLTPGPEAFSFPLDYFLADDQGHVSQGEFWSRNVNVRRINFPRGLSHLRLSVKAKETDPIAGPSFPILAELDDVGTSAVELNSGK